MSLITELVAQLKANKGEFGPEERALAEHITSLAEEFGLKYYLDEDGEDACIVDALETIPARQYLKVREDLDYILYRRTEDSQLRGLYRLGVSDGECESWSIFMW